MTQFILHHHMPRSHIPEYSTKKLPPHGYLMYHKIFWNESGGGGTVLGQISLENSGQNNV